MYHYYYDLLYLSFFIIILFLFLLLLLKLHVKVHYSPYENEDVPLVELCTLYLHACHVIVT